MGKISALDILGIIAAVFGFFIGLLLNENAILLLAIFLILLSISQKMK